VTTVDWTDDILAKEAGRWIEVLRSRSDTLVQVGRTVLARKLGQALGKAADMVEWALRSHQQGQ